jgi:hypothetical protein
MNTDSFGEKTFFGTIDEKIIIRHKRADKKNIRSNANFNKIVVVLLAKAGMKVQRQGAQLPMVNIFLIYPTQSKLETCGDWLYI